MSVCVVLLVQRPSSNATEGRAKEQKSRTRERERGDNCVRQLKKADGNTQGSGQWLDSRDDCMRKMRGRGRQRQSERLRKQGCEKK